MPTLQADIGYVREQLLDLHTQLDIPSPGVPVEMRVDPSCEDEWQSWRLIDSTYNMESIAELEAELPARLPQFFKAYILSYHTLNLDFGEYQLPESWPNQRLSQNFSALLDNTFWDSGYIQFGAARGCGDPLLFDFLSPTPDGTDCAVVLFNHDVVPHSVYGKREDLKIYESCLAPSFRCFFDRLLEHDDSIFPAPISAEEERRNIAWREVAELLEQKGLPPYHRPPEVSSSDPWAIAAFLRNL